MSEFKFLENVNAQAGTALTCLSSFFVRYVQMKAILIVPKIVSHGNVFCQKILTRFFRHFWTSNIDEKFLPIFGLVLSYAFINRT